MPSQIHSNSKVLKFDFRNRDAAGSLRTDSDVDFEFCRCKSWSTHNQVCGFKRCCTWWKLKIQISRNTWDPSDTNTTLLDYFFKQITIIVRSRYSCNFFYNPRSELRWSNLSYENPSICSFVASSFSDHYPFWCTYNWNNVHIICSQG